MSPNRTDYARIETGQHGDLHDDSSTDVEESPIIRQLGNMKWDEYRHAPQPRRTWWRHCCSSVLLQGLLNTILLLFVLVLLVDRRGHQQGHWQLEGSGDITSFIPAVSQQIKSFVPDMAFVPENGSEFFSDAVKDKWLSIVPSTRTSLPLAAFFQC